MLQLPPDVAAGEYCNRGNERRELCPQLFWRVLCFYDRGDDLAEERPEGSKLVWFFRHGQSTGNAVARRVQKPW